MTECIKLFNRPATQQFFESDKVKVRLATKDGNVLHEFKTNGKKQDLWSFFANKPNNGHRIQINLQTTYLNSIQARQVSKDVKNTSIVHQNRLIDGNENDSSMKNSVLGAKPTTDQTHAVKENKKNKWNEVTLEETSEIHFKKQKIVPSILDKVTSSSANLPSKYIVINRM